MKPKALFWLIVLVVVAASAWVFVAGRPPVAAPPPPASATDAAPPVDAGESTQDDEAGRPAGAALAPDAERPKADAPKPALSPIEATWQRLMRADYCDEPGFDKGTSVRQMLADMRRDEASARRVAATEAQLAILCAGEPPVGDESLAGIDPADYLLENSRLLQDVHVFIDLLERDAAAGTPMPEAEQRAFVEAAVGRADGLFEFLEMTQALNEAHVFARGLSGHGYPANLPAEAAGAAAVIAGCRIFGGCEVGSVLAISLCFLQCEEPMSAPEHARASVAPLYWPPATKQAIAAILAARAGP